MEQENVTTESADQDENTTTAEEKNNPLPGDLKDAVSDFSDDLLDDLEGMDVVDSWVDEEEEGVKEQGEDETGKRKEQLQDDENKKKPSTRTHYRSLDRRERRGNSRTRRGENIHRERRVEHRRSPPRKRQSIPKEENQIRKGTSQQNVEKKNEHRRSNERKGERVHREGRRTPERKIESERRHEGNVSRRKTPEKRNEGERRHREGSLPKVARRNGDEHRHSPPRKSPLRKDGERRRSVHRDRSLPRRRSPVRKYEEERRHSVHRDGSLPRLPRKTEEQHPRRKESPERRNSNHSGNLEKRDDKEESIEKKVDEPVVTVVAYPHPSVYKRLHAMNDSQTQETMNLMPMIAPNEPVPPGTEDEFILVPSVEKEDILQKEELQNEDKKGDEMFQSEIQNARETTDKYPEMEKAREAEKEALPEDKDRDRGIKQNNVRDGTHKSRSPRRDFDRSGRSRSRDRRSRSLTRREIAGDQRVRSRSRDRRARSVTRREIADRKTGDYRVRSRSRDRRARSVTRREIADDQRVRSRSRDRRGHSRSRDIRRRAQSRSRSRDRRAHSRSRDIHRRGRSRSRERRVHSRSRARVPLEVETRVVSYKPESSALYERFSSPSLSFELSPVSGRSLSRSSIVRGRTPTRSPRSHHRKSLSPISSSLSLSPEPEYERRRPKQHKPSFLKELAEIFAKKEPQTTYTQPPVPLVTQPPPMYPPPMNPQPMIPFDDAPPQPFVPIQQPPPMVPYPYTEPPPGPYPAPPFQVHPERPALTSIMYEPAPPPAPPQIALSTAPLIPLTVERQRIIDRCQKVIQILTGDENLISGGCFTVFPATVNETQGKEDVDQQDLWRSPLCRGSTTFAFTKCPVQLPTSLVPELEPCKECLERDSKKFVDSSVQTDKVVLCSNATQLDLETYCREIQPVDDKLPNKPLTNPLDVHFFESRSSVNTTMNALETAYHDSRSSVNLPGRATMNTREKGYRDSKSPVNLLGRAQMESLEMAYRDSRSPVNVPGRAQMESLEMGYRDSRSPVNLPGRSRIDPLEMAYHDSRSSVKLRGRAQMDPPETAYCDSRSPGKAAMNSLEMAYLDSRIQANASRVEMAYRDSRSPVNPPTELLVHDYGHSNSSRSFSNLSSSSVYDVTSRSVRMTDDYGRDQLPSAALRNLEDVERMPAPKLKGILKRSSLDSYDNPKDVWSRLGPHESSSPSSTSMGTGADLQKLLELVPSQWTSRASRDYR